MEMIRELILTRLVQEIVNDTNAEQLFDAIFIEETGIDSKNVIEILQNCLLSLKGELSVDDYEYASEYLAALPSNNQEMDYILLKISGALSAGVEDKDLATITSKTFWSLYAIACKKSISMPKVVFENPEAYYSQVSTDTRQQQKAHQICLNAFGMDACRFDVKTMPGLKVFLHPIHSKNKKIRTKKKNLHRVLKTTKKIMQAHKIAHRNDSYHYFMGKSHIVPEEFTRSIVKSFLSEGRGMIND